MDIIDEILQDLENNSDTKEKSMRNFEGKILREMDEKGFKVIKQGYETIKIDEKDIYVKYYIFKNKYTGKIENYTFEYTSINKLRKEK